jgi:hypothetical protein
MESYKDVKDKDVKDTNDIFLQLALAESRKNKVELSLEEIIFILQLPENFIVGHAIDNGGCFFDSIAQSLNFIRKTNEYSEKSLRLICYQYYVNNKKEVDEWNKADNYRGEYRNVQYTEAELFFRNKDKAPIWGRPNVEGRIICKVLKIGLVSLIEINKVPSLDVEGVDDFVPCYSLFDQDNIYDQEEGFYDEDIIMILSVAGELHFNPILPKRALSHEIVIPHAENIPDIDTSTLTQLNELNATYLNEKQKDEYKPYAWATFFGWKNTLAWQDKAQELRIHARNQLLNDTRRMNKTDNNKFIEHAVTLEIFKEHRSNYLNTDGDTDAVVMIKGLKR